MESKCSKCDHFEVCEQYPFDESGCGKFKCKAGHLVVFAKHDSCSQEFLFAVPWYMEVRKGDVLLVDTMHGKVIATATTEMFEGRDIDEVATKCGAYLPLKEVKAVAGQELQSYIKNKIFAEYRKSLNKAVKEVENNI